MNQILIHLVLKLNYYRHIGVLTAANSLNPRKRNFSHSGCPVWINPQSLLTTFPLVLISLTLSLTVSFSFCWRFEIYVCLIYEWFINVNKHVLYKQRAILLRNVINAISTGKPTDSTIVTFLYCNVYWALGNLQQHLRSVDVCVDVMCMCVCSNCGAFNVTDNQFFELTTGRYPLLVRVNRSHQVLMIGY